MIPLLYLKSFGICKLSNLGIEIDLAIKNLAQLDDACQSDKHYIPKTVVDILRMCRPCKSLRNSQPSCIIDGWVVLSKVKEAPESQYLRGEAMMVVMLVRLMMVLMVMRSCCNGGDHLHALHRP